MFEFIRRNEKKIILTAVIAYLFAWLFVFEFDAIWTSVFLPLFIAAGLFIYERVASKIDRERIGYFDLAEFREHVHQSIDSLRESFKDEKADTDFALPAVLTGEMRFRSESGGRQARRDKGRPDSVRSPLTGTDCIAYRVTAGCVKPRDVAGGVTPVSGSKRRKGSAKYSLYLFTNQESVPLSLHDGDESVRIGDTGIYNFSRVTERVVSWSNLGELGSILKDKVENELRLQKIAQKDYTGVVVKEQVLLEHDKCTVYGTCTKDRESIIITGNDKIDDPGSLYITTLKDDERKQIIGGLARSSTLRRLVVIPAVLILVGLAGYSLLKDAFIKYGSIRYQDSPHKRKLEIVRDPKNNSVPDYWYFDPKDGGGFTLLLETDDGQYKASGDSLVTVSNVMEKSSDYTIGRDSSVSWEGSYWRIALGNELPEMTVAKPARGRIYIKNKLDKQYSMRFDQGSTDENDAFTWNWEARAGVSNAYGIYAITHLYDKQGRKTEKDVILETGDSVRLIYGETEISRFFAGFSPELEFVDGTGWSLVISEDTVVPRNARLYVRASPTANYTIEVMGADGRKKYDTWWLFEATTVAEDDQGEYLAIGDDDAVVFPGDSLHVVLKYYTVLYEGPLRDYGNARYDYANGEWKLFAEE